MAFAACKLQGTIIFIVTYFQYKLVHFFLYLLRFILGPNVKGKSRVNSRSNTNNQTAVEAKIIRNSAFSAHPLRKSRKAKGGVVNNLAGSGSMCLKVVGRRDVEGVI